ncbi:hypothetical protein NMG60_11021072 [Bertholletia excelsa]
MDDSHRCPLLPTTSSSSTTTTTSTSVDVQHEIADLFNSPNSKVILRLVFIIFVGSLSLWANHEASKGFDIFIKNDSPDSVAGRRFHLFFVANDKAARLVFDASKFVETILYPRNTQVNKKQVRHVTLRLAGWNLNDKVIVESSAECDLDGFVIHLSPSIMEETNVDEAMVRAVRQSMARVWLYDNNSPKSLVNGMVEYITSLAELKKGFIQRLNQGMRGGWGDRTVDDALGMPAQQLCASYVSYLKGISAPIHWSEAE